LLKDGLSGHEGLKTSTGNSALRGDGDCDGITYDRKSMGEKRKKKSKSEKGKLGGLGSM